MKIKSIILSILKEINQTNLNKVLDVFSNGMNQFSKSMNEVTKELGQDVAESNRKQESESNKNQENLDKIFGNSKPKIWSDD